MSSTILIISAVFPPEPVVSAKLSLDIVNELVLLDIPVTVLHPKPTRPLGFDFDKFNSKNMLYKDVMVSSYTCPKSKFLGRLYESFSFGWKCRAYIKVHYDQLKCIYVNAWPLFSQVLIVNVARKYNIPCIIHVQDIYPESVANKIPSLKIAYLIKKMLIPMDKYILSHASHILAISRSMKDYLSKTRMVDSNKISIIENWQNEDEFIFYRTNNKNKKNNDFLTFMYLGNIGPVAGVEFLIHSFAKAAINKSKLIIAGNGSNKSACMELANIYTDTQIDFLNVPDGKVPEVQDQADIMLLPVRKGAAMSSIPSKLPAYMFSNKPIIGSLDLDSDTAKAIIEADCGIVVTPQNEEELMRAMNEAAKWSEDVIRVKGNNAFLYSMNRFSKKHNLPILIDIIKKYVPNKKD